MTGREFGGIRKELARPDRSPLRNYQSLVLGDGGLLSLLRYELLTGLLGSLGGATGVRLRRVFYAFLLKEAGGGITFGKNVVLRCPGVIRIGADTALDEYVTLSVRGEEAGISLGGGVQVGRGTVINCRGGEIAVGSHVRIGRECRIGSLKGVEIGDRTVIGDLTYLSGAAHATARIDVPIIMQPLSSKGPVRIGESVTVGEEVTVLDGVTIGSGATVAPGSLVNRDVAEGGTVAGVPAREVDGSPSEDSRC
jgi:acetyltransferase-like isoleucine patch superfamily enzyme